MEVRYKYQLDRRSRRITTILLILFIAAAGCLVYRFLDSGPYVPAWFLSIAFAVIALYLLSIPRFIKLTKSSVEIHCLIELTKIHVNDIKSVRAMDRSEMKRTIPLLASYGFFGYYGYYLNVPDWELVKVYCSKWSDFVEIEDIYEQKYIVNCDNPEQLIAQILERKEKGC